MYLQLPNGKNVKLIIQLRKQNNYAVDQLTELVVVEKPPCHRVMQPPIWHKNNTI